MEIEQEHFKKLQEISQCNLAISKAREELSVLKNEHEAYIEARGQEVSKKIQQILEESDVLINTITTNHVRVTEIVNTVTSFATFVEELSKKTEHAIEQFKDMQATFLDNMDRKHRNIDEMQKTLEINKKTLDDVANMLDRRQKQLKTRENVLDGRVKVLTKAYEAEKILWEQIQKKK